MKKTLLIMAAGMGSRFGTGIKQLEPVGHCDEIIMDYSVHDAIKAGFSDIVCVIRRDIEKDFYERIGTRAEKICRKCGVGFYCAFQDKNDIPAGIKADENRVKPWGTGHAVLAARKMISGAFAVINADDYYGKDAFFKMADYLDKEHKENEYCMIGFILGNTLSDNGVVTRGICRQDADGMLCDIAETRHIRKMPDGAEADGVKLDIDSLVSMNMWGFPSADAYFDLLRKGFDDYFRCDYPKDTLNAEYLIPVHIGKLLENKAITVKVIPTGEKWFGMTFKEDLKTVQDSFSELILGGVYREDLYSDLCND